MNDTINLMLHHGWSAPELFVFVIANLFTFVAYYIIGYNHLKKKEQGKGHFWYAAFITSCGIGHLAMAVHMSLWFSPMLMLITHWITALVSLYTIKQLA